MKKIMDLIKKMIYILNRPQKILCILVFLLTILGSLLECLGVTIILPVVNLILEPDILMENTIVKSLPILNDLQYEGLVVLVVGGVIFLYIIKNGFFVFMAWFRTKFACKIRREIAINMMESYMSRGYQFFLSKDYGEIDRGVNGDTSGIYAVINAGFRLFSDLATIFFICVFMLYADMQLAVAVIIMSLICIALVYFVFRRMMLEAGKESREYSAKAGQSVYQAFTGIKDVLILRKQRFFIDTYEENTINVQLAECKATLGQESPTYIIEGVCVSGIMMVVGARILTGEVDSTFVSVLASFAIGAFRILPCLGRTSISINKVLNACPSVNAVYENLQEAVRYAKEHPEVKFGEKKIPKLINKREKNNLKEMSNYNKINKKGFNTRIELKDITFAYEKNSCNILENINLSIEKGQAIGLIGASGAGKSTLVDILLGLLVPSKGEVFMDGVKITSIPELWSKTIAYVPQNVFLSSASILENVAFGEKIDEVDEENVWEALERAELKQFVQSLPEGIMTRTGDRGIRLSGGQRQRIAIARALYHRPEILVLDEATSALDNDTESAIMSAINSLQGQVTMIIVAHRLTTVQKCDVIYEVENKTVRIKKKDDIFWQK